MSPRLNQENHALKYVKKLVMQNSLAQEDVKKSEIKEAQLEEDKAYQVITQITLTTYPDC